MAADNTTIMVAVEKLAEQIVETFIDSFPDGGDGLTAAQIGVLGNASDTVARNTFALIGADPASATALHNEINAANATIGALGVIGQLNASDAFVSASREAIKEAFSAVVSIAATTAIGAALAERPNKTVKPFKPETSEDVPPDGSPLDQAPTGQIISEPNLEGVSKETAQEFVEKIDTVQNAAEQA